MNILCDIDGTIADITHRLHYIRTEGQKKDWPAFFKACVDDKPLMNTISVISELAVAGHDIIFVSGRSGVVRQETLDWLFTIGFNACNFDETLTCGSNEWYYTATLHMRKAGDYRADYIVKEEMMQANGWTPENTLCVFDDRNQIVDMWRSHDFTVFQVAPGDF